MFDERTMKRLQAEVDRALAGVIADAIAGLRDMTRELRGAVDTSTNPDIITGLKLLREELQSAAAAIQEAIDKAAPQ